MFIREHSFTVRLSLLPFKTLDRLFTNTLLAYLSKDLNECHILSTTQNALDVRLYIWSCLIYLTGITYTCNNDRQLSDNITMVEQFTSATV